MSYLDDISTIWDAVIASIKEEYHLAQTIVDLWFTPLQVYAFDDNKITFSTDSEFKHKIINDKYIPMIKKGFAEQLGFDIEVEVIFVGTPADVEKMKRQILGDKMPDTAPDKNEAARQVSPSSSSPVLGALPQNYSFQYTFDNFIVGNSNKFAHAACMAVAARPAMDYNPLFIYGPSGLGKTHLLSAVVNEIRRKNPDVSVVYIKGDDFTNQMIESLSRHEMNKFHDKYRNCDVLLIDDIQFIAGKDSTQEEFFHTFNTLYEEQKQIILTSDRPPRDIQTLEDRLRTRFEWGLLADIQPPDLELRIAIIKKKAEQVSIEIPDEVLNFLADNLRSNIRQIEGAIKKLRALTFVSGQSISMDMARSCLSELLGGAEPVSVTVDKVFAAVYRKYNISKEDLVGTKRNKEIAQARHITIYLIRTITEMSYPNIGKLFGRDHTTIISSYELISQKTLKDPLFNLELDNLVKEISEA